MLGGKADIDQRPTNSVPDPMRISGCRSPRNHHARVDADAAVEVHNVFVIHADAAVRHESADRARRIGDDEAC